MSHSAELRRLSRREMLRLMGAAAGMSALAACAPMGAPAAAPSPAATGAAAAAKPRSGGALRIGSAADLTTLDPHWQQNTQYIVLPVFDVLARYDDSLVLHPELAESWEMSKDGKELTFRLRKGVLYHNGREFTAEDVKWNVIRAQNPKVGSGQLAAQSAWIKEMVTPDKYTITWKLDAPRLGIYDFVNTFQIGNKEQLEGPDATKQAIGTGPFKFVEWVPGDHIKLAKNKDYYFSGQPYLDEVNYIIIKDLQALVVQFESGAIDYAANIPEPEVIRLQKDGRYRVVPYTTGGSYYLIGLNCGMAPTNNKKVRQALNYALDRKRIVDTVTLGLGAPAALPWVPKSAAYDATKNAAYGFNLEKATALLKEAGASNLELDIVFTGSNQSLAAIAQIYQSDLAKIGVKLSVQGVDSLRYRDYVDKVNYKGMFISTSKNADNDPSTLFTLGKPFSTSANLSGFKSDTYTKLVDAIASENDLTKRKELINQVNDFMLDESFVIVVSPLPYSYAYRSNVQGSTTAGMLSLGKAWLSQ